MNETFTILLLITVILAAILYTYYNHQPGHTSPEDTIVTIPPRIPGGLPLLGNAIQLGTGGTLFLQHCQQQCANTNTNINGAFTLYVAGQQMTFIFSPKSILHFFKAPDSQITFAPAVEQFTYRVFGLPPKDFLPKHHLLLTTMRHQVGMQSNLKGHAERLLPFLMDELKKCIDAVSSQIELFSLLQDIVFSAAVKSLFGTLFLEYHGYSRIKNAFSDFEACFEHAASPIPHIFQPKFRKSRKILLDSLRESYLLGHFEGTTVDILLKKSDLPRYCRHNMLLAVLWASQANTLPATFWSLTFLLLPKHKKYLDTIRKDLPTSLSSASSLIDMCCDSSSLLSRCCLEALRLRSPSIDVRIAAENILIPTNGITSSSDATQQHVLSVKKGSVIAVSPYLTHLDEAIYGPTASLFDPDRSGMCLGTAAHSNLVHSEVAGVGGLGGIAFGGGAYRCPGRIFAIMELSLVVGLMLTNFDLKLIDRKEIDREKSCPGDANMGLLPAMDMSRLVGVKVPKEPCFVQMCRRKDLYKHLSSSPAGQAGLH